MLSERKAVNFIEYDYSQILHSADLAYTSTVIAYLPHSNILDTLTKWSLIYIAHFECITAYFNQVVEKRTQGS